MIDQQKQRHSFSYRHQIADPLFRYVGSGGSALIVGAASMGKSRLLQHVLRPDVQAHFLGEKSPQLTLIWVDCHRSAELSEWGLFELILTSLAERFDDEALRLAQKEVILSKDWLFARRTVESVVQRLCLAGHTLYFLFDEFDHLYQSLPALAISSLRALRDRHKYQLGYLLFTRNLLERLRPDSDDLAITEGFRELFGRHLIGLTPFNSADSSAMLVQLSARKGKTLSAELQTTLHQLTGGHPGMLLAGYELMIQSAETPPHWQTYLQNSHTINNECLKLWLGLGEDEQLALLQLAQGHPIDDPELEHLLHIKGLICQTVLFSPLFAHFVRTHATLKENSLRLDVERNEIWTGNRCITDLSGKPFELLKLLYEHHGEVCERDEILKFLYPSEHYDVNSNTVDNLVRRIRVKIEIDPRQPLYLRTVQGRGYKLILDPSQD